MLTFDVSASFKIVLSVALKNDDAASRTSIAVDNLTTQVEVTADSGCVDDVATLRLRQSGNDNLMMLPILKSLIDLF